MKPLENPCDDCPALPCDGGLEVNTCPSYVIYQARLAERKAVIEELRERADNIDGCDYSNDYKTAEVIQGAIEELLKSIANEYENSIRE